MSKLSLHSQENGAEELLAFLKRFGNKPEYVVCISPPEDAIKGIEALGIKVIVRQPWRFDFNPDQVRAELGSNPMHVAHEFVNLCRSQSFYPYMWAAETPPAMVDTSTPDLFPWAIAFWQEAQRLFAGDGKECIVGNWSNTHHGFLVPSARYYGVQEYGGENWPFVTISTHYREWFPQILQIADHTHAPRLFILECGVTALLAPQEVKDAYDGSNDGPGRHGLDVGYRGGHGIPTIPSDVFLSGLREYDHQLQADNYVAGGYAYGYGMNPDWGSHEISGDRVVEDGLIALYSHQGPILTPIEEGAMAEVEYGFAGLFDGFDELVGRIGVNIVGKPLHGARYLGGDYAYQVTEKGRLEAVKLDDGSWSSAFYPKV